VPPQAREGPLVYDAQGALLFVSGLGVDARVWAPPDVPQWSLRWVPFAGAEAPMDERRTVAPRGDGPTG
jgi:hypothetical protein